MEVNKNENEKKQTNNFKAVTTVNPYNDKKEKMIKKLLH